MVNTPGMAPREIHGSIPGGGLYLSQEGYSDVGDAPFGCLGAD